MIFMAIVNNTMCFVTVAKPIMKNVEFCLIYFQRSMKSFIFHFVHLGFQSTNNPQQEP